MNFNNLELKSDYSSLTDDVYDEFFNKILKSTKLYYRMGGRFSSKNFALCAEGLQEFIQNDGTMKLILMPEFTEKDADSINKGVKNADEIISECWISEFTEIREKFVQDHTRALAWMIANGNLEIRIVVPINHNGSVISHTTLQESQIFSQAIGIFWDEDNNIISFSGDVNSDDELLGEYYRFRVYRSMDDSENKYLEKDFEEFDQYWEGRESYGEISWKTIPLPDAIKHNLIKIAPKSKSDIKLTNIPRLRSYQKKAVRNWIENGNQGIFEMATGTGKTFTAIGCIDKIKKSNKNTLVVIACPFDNLERQWQKELKKWGFDSSITSGNAKWHQSMGDKIASLKVDESQNLSILITTYVTFSSDKFVKMIENSDVTTMLIADEVHNAGSPRNSRGLNNAYDYRLGLSATLERYFDPEGTRMLKEFFGDTVYALDLATAIQKKFLVNYYYFPIYVDLTDEEYEKYATLTRTIARLWNSKSREEREQLEMTLLKRARIIRDATNKLKKFEEWLSDHTDNAKYSLMYCSENQIPHVTRTLNKNGITNREFTAKNPSDPKQRTEILNKFCSGHYDAIVANRVLDEGADIPAAKNCIMLASTGNPKQFIQRRGRVLRKLHGTYGDKSKKMHANIYDILVIPDVSPGYTEDVIRTERQIVSSQIKRQEEMARIALNSDECMAEIEDIKKKFSLS